MAPKSDHDHKGKKALKVLNPSSQEGQKKRLVEESSKDKDVSKKRKIGESSTTLESNTPYFNDDKGEERYNSIFRFRKIFNGRWVDYEFFNSHSFELNDKLKFLGWKSLTTLRDDVYPDLVAHFYANAERGQKQSSIKSFVKGKSLSLSREVLGNILEINLGKEVSMEKVSRKEQLDTVFGKDLVDSTQPTAFDFPLELKLVHHFACNIFVPKAGKYEFVTDKELFLLWAYLTDTKIDLPLLILDHMFKATFTKASLPYGILLTKVFKHFDIDLRDEKKRTPKAISDEFNARTLKRMRYALRNGKWVLRNTKKVSEEEQTPSGSTSRGRVSRKSIIPALTDSEGDMKSLLTQILESMEKLNKKADLASTRMILIEKKVRELKREIILLRKEKGKDEEEEGKEENEEEEGRTQEREDREEEPENVAGEEEEFSAEKGNDKEDEDDKDDEEESSETESDTPAPSAGHRYGLRFRPGSKFSNTIDDPLVLTPSPPSSP